MLDNLQLVINRRNQTVIMFITILLFTSCNLKKKENNKALFVDEFEKKIEELERNNIGVVQYLRNGEQLDTIVLHEVDWKKELSIFIENTITEKTLNDYTIKNSLEENWRVAEYSCKNSKNSIRNLLWKQDDAKSFIYSAKIKKENRLSTIEYVLEFNSNKGYLITSNQSLPYSYEGSFRIEGKFIK